MRKIILIFTLFIGLEGISQTGFKHITAKGGFTYIDKAFFNFEVGLELNRAYFTNWSLFLSGYNFKEEKNYTLGIYYEPNIYASKNNFANLKFGSSAGSNQKKFIMDAIIGIEYYYAFTENLKFTAYLKNNYMFWSKIGFRNSALIGLKYRL